MCVLGYSKEKLERTKSPVDGARICIHMCQLKIGLEAQFMLQSWALAGKWNSMNTQWKKQPGTKRDKENIASIRVDFRPQTGKFTLCDTISTLRPASLFIRLTTSYLT